MRSAIITGATGFIGRQLTAELLSMGVEVTAWCRANSLNIDRLPPGVRIGYDDSGLAAADVFYHLAWDGASGAGRGDAVLQSRNAEMTLTALETARKLGCGKFIALGTVYERFAPQIAGTEKFGGSDFYILSKKYAHDMSKQLALKWGMGFVWATICHPIGKNIKPEQMMAYVIAKLLDGVAPEFGPAATLYDIVAVEDVAFGLRLIGEGVMAQSEYYIGGGSVKPLAAWLEETRKILGVDTPIGIGRRPDDGLRFEREWFDRSVLAAETGYAPKVSFEKAVRNTAGWLRPR